MPVWSREVIGCISEGPGLALLLMLSPSSLPVYELFYSAMLSTTWPDSFLSCPFQIFCHGMKRELFFFVVDISSEHRQRISIPEFVRGTQLSECCYEEVIHVVGNSGEKSQWEGAGHKSCDGVCVLVRTREATACSLFFSPHFLLLAHLSKVRWELHEAEAKEGVH